MLLSDFGPYGIFMNMCVYDFIFCRHSWQYSRVYLFAVYTILVKYIITTFDEQK
jgi:hypothetical protein